MWALVDSANSSRITAVVFGVGAVGLIGAGVVHYLLNLYDAVDRALGGDADRWR